MKKNMFGILFLMLLVVFSVVFAGEREDVQSKIVFAQKDLLVLQNKVTDLKLNIEMETAMLGIVLLPKIRELEQFISDLKIKLKEIDEAAIKSNVHRRRGRLPVQ